VRALEGEREFVHALVELAPQKLRDRTFGTGRAAALQAREVAVGEILHRLDVDIELGESLADEAAIELAGTVGEALAGKRGEILENVLKVHHEGERKRRAFVHQGGQGDAPSAVQRTEEIFARDADLLEEHLVEFG